MKIGQIYTRQIYTRQQTHFALVMGSKIQHAECIHKDMLVANNRIMIILEFVVKVLQGFKYRAGSNRCFDEQTISGVF